MMNTLLAAAAVVLWLGPLAIAGIFGFRFLDHPKADRVALIVIAWTFAGTWPISAFMVAL